MHGNRILRHTVKVDIPITMLTDDKDWDSFMDYIQNKMIPEGFSITEIIVKANIASFGYHVYFHTEKRDIRDTSESLQNSLGSGTSSKNNNLPIVTLKTLINEIKRG